MLYTGWQLVHGGGGVDGDGAPLLPHDQVTGRHGVMRPQTGEAQPEISTQHFLNMIALMIL